LCVVHATRKTLSDIAMHAFSARHVRVLAARQGVVHGDLRRPARERVGHLRHADGQTSVARSLPRQAVMTGGRASLANDSGASDDDAARPRGSIGGVGSFSAAAPNVCPMLRPLRRAFVGAAWFERSPDGGATAVSVGAGH
jgi:hypothetical protein